MEERGRLSIVRGLGMMMFYPFSFSSMLRRLLPFALAAACAGASAAPSSAIPAKPMTLASYLALSGPAPSATFAYGSAPSQYAELFLPRGAGPFPVAVLNSAASPSCATSPGHWRRAGSPPGTSNTGASTKPAAAIPAPTRT
jgi:hypothetical protein